MTMDHRAALTATGLIHQVARELTTALERRLAPHDITTQQAALLINAARGLFHDLTSLCRECR